MHQYDIEAAITNAVNLFATSMGFIYERPYVNSIRPSGESTWFDNVELVTKKVNVTMAQYSFDFLAVVESWQECKLYMDSVTAILVMELRINQLRAELQDELNKHLSTYPHNMGM